MNIAVTGATGRMGRTVIETAIDHEDVTVAFGIDPDVESGEVAGVRVYHPDELESLLEEARPNAVIDFTVPEAAVATAEAAADAAAPMVIGTTGFDDDQERRLGELAERVPILKTGNFSRGIQALLIALEDALSALPGYDVEVTETHHNGKLDAPSGTAGMILDRIESVRGESERVHGRVGDQPREDGEVGVHARRVGDVGSEHEVLIGGNEELLTLNHRSSSRRVFAEGAVDAAVWLAGQRPDLYGFDDVLEVGE
jgi:4-hydroxy-tetrahydrodipicolinate reductase